MVRKSADERWDDVQRQLGRLEEAQARAVEDRTEIKEAVRDFRAVADELRGAISGLAQTVQSMTNSVIGLNQEKCGERLTVIETEIGIYKRIFGSGAGLLARILIALAGAAAAGGGGAVLFLGLHPH